MVTDGWWAPPHEVGVHTETAIRMQLTREVTTEAASRLLEAMRCTLSPAHITQSEEVGLLADGARTPARTVLSRSSAVRHAHGGICFVRCS